VLSKEHWRNEITELRKKLTINEWNVWSEQIHEKLYNSQTWIKAKTVCLYYSVNKEVDTISILERAWNEKKLTYLPKCRPKQKELIFYRVESLEQLSGTFYGIPEPDPNLCEIKNILNFDLIIVPGLVFDEFGYRVGYGGGYYDRFLGGLEEDPLKVGLAFPFQVIEGTTLPHETYDVPVNQLITPGKIINCKRDRIG
jgi:5-formyltetrahydrofolate cyclo-ligase